MTKSPKPIESVGQLLTVDDVADQLRVSTKTVRRLIERGDLPECRIGHSVRVLDQDLTQYIHRNRQ